MHKPLSINNIGLSFPTKTCFQNFTTQIPFGSRIAIIGKNGSGKSSLLKLLLGILDTSEGNISRPDDLILGYVPQVDNSCSKLSGGEHFNSLLTQALSSSPNCLLLDEPSNHLDKSNRHSLFRFLDNYPGSLIIASHDQQLLHHSVNELWHIEDGQITVFNGNYKDYCREITIKKTALMKKIIQLNAQKKDSHKKLMKEQERAKKRKIYGENKYDGDKLALRSAQGRGQRTANKNLKMISEEKTNVFTQLAELKRSEIIKPKFNLRAQLHNKIVVSIREGAVGYDLSVLKDINFTLIGNERVAITGPNGSGKSTFMKAILDSTFRQVGDWQTPKPEDIGYLDQQYATLCGQNSVYDTIQALTVNWHPQELRNHLNLFLFRKNEEINLLVCNLSGGEKVRLCLAQIAANTPRLLLLDEITNNLDLETKTHIMQVLQDYPGGMIVISHDENFLQDIKIDRFYTIEQNLLLPVL